MKLLSFTAKMVCFLSWQSDELEFTGDSDEEEDDDDGSTARATAQTGQTTQDLDSDIVTPVSRVCI